MRSLVAGEPRDRPDLVVVPGLGALGYLVPLVRACAGWTRVHLLDLPGFGDPRTARLPADLASLTAAVDAWLDRHGEPVLLLGHSTGAQVVLRAGSPHATARVLGGPTFPPELRRLPPLAAAVLRTLPKEQLRQVPAVLPYYRRGWRRLPQLLASALADEPGGGTADLVLRGRHDHVSPAAWAERLGPVVTLPGGHNAPYAFPHETSEVLRRLGT